MHSYPLLEILAIGLSLALVFGYLAHRIGLSPIVGYLLAGFIIGPQTPGFVADSALAHDLSEAGVILLMFGVGLHFDMKDLLAVKGVALPGAIAQSTVAAVLGTYAAMAFGFTFAAALMLGFGLAVASTVVLLRVLTDNGMLDSVHGHVAVGWLVVEDLFTILILVLLPSISLLLSDAGSLSTWDMLLAFGEAILRITLLWVMVLVVGGKVVPWLLTRILRTRSQELFTLSVLVMAFATAVGAAIIFQASMALGAFLGGMVIGRTKVSHQAGADLLPLRDAFSVLFFIAVGMLFQPTFILEEPWLILLCLGIVLLAKPLVAFVMVIVLGYSVNTALVAAISLGQIGEFSFILAQGAMGIGLATEAVYNVLVVCAIISISLNPIAFRWLPKILAALQKRPQLWSILIFTSRQKAKRASKRKLATQTTSHDLASADLQTTAVVVGYGPTGKSVCQTLMANGITPVVIDLNVDTVNKLNEKERWTIFGDSSKKEVLQAAGIEKAGYLVVTTPNLDATVSTVALAKQLNPDIRALVRARFLDDGAILHTAGVEGIAFEEEEVAAALTNLVMEDVAACAQQPATGTPALGELCRDSKNKKEPLIE